MSKMLRERGGALEFRMEKIKGGKFMIDHEANTFKVVPKDETETTDHSGVRPIDANWLRGKISNTKFCVKNPEMMAGLVEMKAAALREIENAPTIEAEPVRHGRWIAQEDADGDISFVCSECGRRLRWDEDFCPSCGSDMRTVDTKD